MDTPELSIVNESFSTKCPRKYVYVAPATSATANCSVRGRVVALWSGSCLWLSKGFLALLDQGLISGSNFLVTILLARWLTAEQYGAYALAFSIFLLSAGIHQSLLLEPMSVLGPASYPDRQRAYLGALLWIQGVLGLMFFALLGFSALVAHHFAFPGGLASALAGLALSTPCVLLFWLVRQAFYLQQSPAPSAAGAFLYSALLLSGLMMVYRRGLLSPFAAYLMMAVGAVATSALMLVRLRPSLKPTAGPSLSQVWQEHWYYGRWALGTSAVKWVPGNIFYALTGTLLGMADVGALKALLNLFLPLAQAANALSGLFLPYVASTFGRQGLSATKAPVQKITLLYFSGGVVYLVLFMLFQEPIFVFLYGGKFMQFLYLVPWVIFSAILNVGSYGPALGLRAIQSPSSVFVTYCVAGLASTAFSITLTWIFGLPGAIASLVLSGLTVLVANTLLFRRKLSGTGEVGRRGKEILMRPNSEARLVQYPAKQFYKGEQAKDYDQRRTGTALRRLEWNRERSLLKEFVVTRLQGNATILDAPAGTGRFLPMLQQLGHCVTGMDISGDMLNLAKDRLQKEDASLVLGDCELLPFKNEAFDYVVSIRCMGHMPPKARIKVLQEFKRVSKKGLIVDMPILNPLTALKSKLGNTLYRRRTGERRRPWWPATSRSLAEELAEAGLRISEKRWFFGPLSQIAFLYLNPIDPNDCIVSSSAAKPSPLIAS